MTSSSACCGQRGFAPLVKYAATNGITRLLFLSSNVSQGYSWQVLGILTSKLSLIQIQLETDVISGQYLLEQQKQKSNLGQSKSEPKPFLFWEKKNKLRSLTYLMIGGMTWSESTCIFWFEKNPTKTKQGKILCAVELQSVVVLDWMQLGLESLSGSYLCSIQADRNWGIPGM